MQTTSHATTAKILAFSHEQGARELVAAWCEAIGKRNADTITELYADDAVLIPTLNDDALRSPLAIHRYFSLLVTREDLRVTMLEQDFRMIDTYTAMHTGSYVFRFTQEGVEVKLPARFSFICQQHEGKWRILHHHSSQLPQASTA